MRPLAVIVVVLLGACSPQTRRPAMIAGGVATAAGLTYAIGAAMSAPIGSCDANTQDCDGSDPMPGLVLALAGVVVAFVATASPDAPPPPIRNVVPPEDLPR